jgi:hypothetical protein
MLRVSVAAKTTITFGTLVIASLSIVGSVGNQKALAANLCGSGFC